MAHRFVYEKLVGPIPDDKYLCHKCDSPFCVNPRHMFIGTAKENMLDAARKERTTFGLKPLPRETVLKLRVAALLGGKSQKQIAAEFGTHQAVVSRVKNGKMYRRYLK